MHGRLGVMQQRASDAFILHRGKKLYNDFRNAFFNALNWLGVKTERLLTAIASNKNKIVCRFIHRKRNWIRNIYSKANCNAHRGVQKFSFGISFIHTYITAIFSMTSPTNAIPPFRIVLMYIIPRLHKKPIDFSYL